MALPSYSRNLPFRLSRRALLRGVTAIALGTLLAACGQEPRGTILPSAPTATPPPTRIPLIPTPLPTITPAPPPSATATTPDPVVFVWKAEHGLLHPGHLALDGHGGLYVTDDENQRIVKFDTNGQFVLAWGTQGIGDGEFRFRSAHQDHSPIAGIAVDTTGMVLVADATARVQQFDPAGRFVGVWSAEDGMGSLPVIPSALAVDRQGNRFLVDTNNDRILKFTSTGRRLLAWGSVGSGIDQFSVPSAITCDRAGNVYVVDINNNRVQQFDGTGRLLGKWGESGFADGRFSGPSGVTVDNRGNVYVADTGNHRIQQFTGGGQFVATWGKRGANDGEMHDPTDVAVDEQGDIYVVDDSNNRILKFHRR